MKPNYYLKTQRRMAPFAMAIIFLLLTGLGTKAHEPGPIVLYNASPPADPIVIDFEDLAPDGPGTPATVLVTSQYADKGITFNGPVALDYSKGIPIPGFARSGTKAIEQCYSKEFCTTPIEMNFTAAQARVKVWVGYSQPLGESRSVILRAFDASGVEVGSAVTTLSPSSSPQPIDRPIEVSSASANIVRAAVSFSPGTMFTNWLAIDDVEFDATLPICFNTQPPVVTLNSRLNAQRVQINAFIPQGNIATQTPLESATLIVTGSNGSRSLDLLGSGLISRSGGDISLARIKGILSPGRNTVIVNAQNCQGTGQSSAIIIYDSIADGTRFVFMGLEVTQAIQDMSNSVPLIADKRTFLRVYLRVEGPTSEIFDVSGTLTASRPGDFLSTPLTPTNLESLNKIIVNSSDDITDKRRDIDASLNFELPPEWIAAGQLQVRLSRLDIDGTPSGLLCDGCQNQGRFGPIVYEFKDAPPVRLFIASVPYTMPDATGITQTYEPHPAEFDLLVSWLKRAYPTSAVISAQITAAPFDGLPSCGSVNKKLSSYKTLGLLKLGLDESIRYYGMVSDEGKFMRGCTSHIPGFTASGPTGVPGNPHSAAASAGGWDTDGSYGDWYGGHEIAHMFGRYHAEFCDAADGKPYPYPGGLISGPDFRYFGFDLGDPGNKIAQQVYAPDVWTDVMTYCRSEWISNFTYEGILNQLSHDIIIAPISPGLPLTASSDALFVVGSLNLTKGSVQLDSFLRLPGLKLSLRPESSNFSIDLFDGVGSLLARYPFDPKEDTDAAPNEDKMALITEVVQYVSNTKRIVISKDGAELASRSVSNNTPRVEVKFPNGGETLEGQTRKVIWQASDADGDQLSYSLLYSTDAGQTWQPIDTNIKASNYVLKLEELPGSNSALIRVIATDGVNTSTDDSDATFRVSLKDPQARIISPADSAVFSTTQTIVLVGEANDLEDGLLDGQMLQWSSDKQGALGSGRSLAVTGLVPGTHEITLTATDMSGAAGKASIVVQITPVIPTIVVGSPLLIRCPANITINAPPGQDFAVVDLPPPMVNKPEGTVVSFSPPSGSQFPVGTTDVTVTAIDASGNTAACTFTVTVNLAGPPPLAVSCVGSLHVVVPPGQPRIVNYPRPVLNKPEGATLVCLPPAGSSFPVGTTIVNCTANNAGGETASCSFIVNVH